MSAPATPKPVDPRAPDQTREGLFQTHDCWRCEHGKKPCPNGQPSRCDYPIARNH